MSERDGATRSPEERLRVLESELAAAQAHNGRLVATLRDAREQIVALKAEVDRLAEPPGSYGVFLSRLEDGSLDVAVAGRKMRLVAIPDVDTSGLRPGQEVMLNESLNIVGVCVSSSASARSSCSRRCSRTVSEPWSSAARTRSVSWRSPSRCCSAP